MSIRRDLAWLFVGVVTALTTFPETLAGATYRVDAADPDAANTPGCGTVATPCRAIQAAVNKAASGDTILVAESTYLYDGSLDPSPCLVSTGVVCIVNKELTFLGGYSGGDWVTRDPSTHLTIIDGENTTRGLLVKRGSPTAVPASATVDGFIIERGAADRSPADGDDAYGGGISAVLVDDVIIRNAIIRDSSAIGATSSTVGGAGRGGGISIRGSDALTTKVILNDVVVEDNVAMGGEGDESGGRSVGGGLFLKDIDELSSSNLVVQRNSAQGGDSDGSGLFGGRRADALGGGIGMLTNDSSTFDDLTVSDNSSEGGDPNGTGGTGGNSFGGGFYGERSTVEIHGGEISGNAARGGSAVSGTPANPAKGSIGAGGGITTFEAQLVMTRVVIVDNTAMGGDGPADPADGTRGTVGGGGAYFEETSIDGDGRVSITNSVIADNTAELGSGSGASGGGGGIFLLGIDVDLNHVVLAGNSLSELLLGGLGLVVNTRRSGFPDELPSNVTLTFSTISDHLFVGESAVRVNALSTVDFDDEETLFANNSINWDGSGTVTGTANILTASDVDFVSPGPPDFDYHLLTSSPAVDAATGSAVILDLDAHLRGVAPDLGADEACLAADDDLVVSGETMTGVAIREACNTLIVGSSTVTGTGIVTFRAPVSVALDEDFNVEQGGSLRIENVVP